MKIELYEMGRMSQTGNSLLRGIQNNSLPLLDLFLRESLQNSLDAADDSSENYINIDVIYDSFDTLGLAKHFEGIENTLSTRYKNNSNYIAVRDSKTVGLTGDIGSDISEGNLYSLVYGINQAQETKGSGGSWGLGKTSYFRLGIGMVIYYTRIKIGKGKYESRLVATLVEDQKEPNCVLPNISKSESAGIAWWGDETKDGSTIPITNIQEIEYILDTLNFPMYKGDETGTSIIIPYIDHKDFMKSNYVVDLEASDERLPFWYDDIDEFIKVVIQRWYYPRLDNNLYDGKHLNVSINGNKLIANEMEPIFKVMTDLYNIAYNGFGSSATNIRLGSKHSRLSREKLSEMLYYPELKYLEEDITVTRYFEDSVVGTLSMVTVTRDFLQESMGEFYPSIYKYMNLLHHDETTNRPVLTFTRKPGMIVSYETESPWLNRAKSTDKTEYNIGMFVLNSKNMLRSEYLVNEKVTTIEDYVRAGEPSDHTKWEDSPTIIENTTIIKNLINNTSRKFSNTLYEKPEPYKGDVKSVLSGRYGDILLPSTSFGKKANYVSRTRPVTSVQNRKIAKAKISMDYSEIFYTSNGLKVPFIYHAHESVESVKFEIKVALEVGSMKAYEFEELNSILPFYLESISIKESNIEREIALDRSDQVLKFKVDMTPNGIPYGLTIFDVKKSGDIEGYLNINTSGTQIRLNIDSTLTFGEEN